MTDVPDLSVHLVLHVCSCGDEQTVEISSAVESSGLQVERCGDVYRGMARLCALESAVDPPVKTPATRLLAVVVCVNDLGPAELEFFSLARRIRRNLPIYVHGPQRFDFRAAKAIELGATSRVTAEIIDSLASAVPGNRDDGAGSQDPPAATSPESIDAAESAVGWEPAPVAPVEIAPPAEPDVDDCEGSVGEASPEPARVPWLRYDDKPARAAPQRTGEPRHPPSATVPSTQAPADSDDREPRSPAPLLTEAELNALIGDDISAVAPEERTGFDAENGQEGEGVP